MQTLETECALACSPDERVAMIELVTALNVATSEVERSELPHSGHHGNGVTPLACSLAAGRA